MNKKNKRWISIIIFGIGVIILSIASMMIINGGYKISKKENKKDDKKVEITESVNNYVAYIKINPSIKLEYSETCKDNICEKPVVQKYELVNDDAKEIFKDIDLLKDKNNLEDVMSLICETLKQKNISFDTVEVYSDWSNIKTYLDNNKKSDETWNYNTNVVESNKINETIETKEQEEKKNQEEAIKKVEKEKKAQEEKKEKEEASKKQTTTQNDTPTNTQTPSETNTRNDYTIYLSDGVTYGHSGMSYCCDNCFTNDLINQLKSAKGYKITKADNSVIDLIRITSLSGNYNTPTFKGEDFISKITAQGGDPEKCDHGGLGGEPESLTKEVCNDFHLVCE